jgi:hypothetical protein
MTMRFRPANIRLINRRSNLPRLLLALSSINGKSNDKNNTTNVQGLTGHSISGRKGVVGQFETILKGHGGAPPGSRAAIRQK